MPTLALFRQLSLPCLLAAASLAHAAPAYRLQVINQAVPTHGVDGLNNHGIGISAFRRNGEFLAYTFDTRDGTVSILRNEGLSHADYPGGINDRGQAALTNIDSSDWYNIQTRAEVYDSHTRTFTVLPPAIASGAAYAFGINSTGVVAGAVALDRSDRPGMHAAIWKDGVLIDIGAQGTVFSVARAINDNGAVAGEAQLTGGTDIRQAFLYDATGMHGLGTLGGYGSWANDVNNSNTVVGGSGVSDAKVSAFIYQNGVMTAMDLPGYSDALDVNNSGVAVGYCSDGGFVYANGHGTLLDTLIDPAGGWHVTHAGAINDLGQIGALACKSGGFCSATVLTPVPEPSAYCMLLGGLGLLGALARRRRAPA